ncbi:RING finger protein 39-like [Rhinatrema bivittatum]|uniref:RING finger protein 39-like n=1 Tax=Rhinatrema bivittatum TaxID=194408 RepID=UPI00112B82C7|nr:RING finger protein 39-like [Rhinatrema bivittatum]
MATTGPIRELQDETLCPACSRYFDDPVTLECDHSYCRACIARHWRQEATAVPAGPGAGFSCPCCGRAFEKRNLRTNIQLAVMVRIAKNLNFAPAEGREPRRRIQPRPATRSMVFNQGEKDCH